MQKGSCACGAITYELDDDNKAAMICYCRDCNKTSSGGALFLRTDKVNLRLKGSPKFWATNATQSGKESRRYFCPECGVHLWVEVDQWPSILTLKVGTLDDYADITLATEVHTRNAIKAFQPVQDVGQKRIP
ncbi:hypothetical protein CC85DRAFT_283993 [Cutaneotrichosporon oleaginosum]|uniref:CENP-V/GFA domain-containing protein n=1 Tax=Cutaneotrichosporon oleaginosum TaxID=879819 RepID=A0A0J0XSA2_9TREE|nr:uncharacterized protein CC85DRAFT_283993 [Cutaneotrichosporon oleaginosum]KLT43950.1 hypothetical protein CC85DRAFT_283993 [Cutaneotrichosporon oleaginosum]TXT04103.1 hypothetical protein COLE_07800 [Cutaneotrichosporon oleaginosum]